MSKLAARTSFWGRKYPLTAYYVNLGLTFQIDRHIWRILPRWG
jgi:hypothetical protein